MVRKPTSSGQWSWDGGTAITVAPGETVDSIAHRHGVPVAVIMEANNLASPNAIQAGQRQLSAAAEDGEHDGEGPARQHHAHAARSGTPRFDGTPAFTQ